MTLKSGSNVVGPVLLEEGEQIVVEPKGDERTENEEENAEEKVE